MNKRKKLLNARSMKLFNKTYGNIHHIETLGAFDGPGIRYVLFLQGCPLKCKYCHNPDSWTTKENQVMSVEEVLRDYKKYSGFYKKGGLTVSGGEPLLQLKFLEELFEEAKKRKIHTCLDTSAATFKPHKKDEFRKLLAVVDLVLLDIKHIDNDEHIKLTGSPNKNILEFAKHLNEINVKTGIRHVLVPAVNDDDKYLLKLRKFLDKLSNIVSIDILPYHKSGISKWDKMGVKYPFLHIEEPTADLIAKAEKILKRDYIFSK